MYLSSQRVERPDGNRAINASFARHGPRLWSGHPPFLPEEDSGELQRERIELSGEALRLLSWLEVVTPDATDVDELVAEFQDLVDDDRLAPPFVRVTGLCWFRFALHHRPKTSWLAELRSLFARGVQLL